MRIDLHTHSTASDGTTSPREVVAAAAAEGLAVVGLTDHDTTVGWGEAAAAAGEFGVALVRGTEISTRERGVSVHLLSYLHDLRHPALARVFADSREERQGRARRMVERIARDYPLTWGDVAAQAAPGATIGRPHIADALIAAGVVRDRDQAFADLLYSGGPYAIPNDVPSPAEVIPLVLEAGGVPVLAHPFATARGSTLSAERIAALAAVGLVGVEVDHRDHTEAQRAQLRGLAAELGLLVTGSSDYHGAGKPNRLGENTTAPQVLERIEELGVLEVLR
ncbi:PHP domain-containing protein [Serinibacter salmoneus]|uniref:Polymerase/histidinol phosphatase N-terminal domain-containing protein n=1 Tax=Serinibacter salmoneus TaxID=556530 RepID=A0A2A9CXH1_9MICO|nr:PHP domain-containing protein [Serinibacter salmoneus]PFG19124.1 hypothetical protein ATL40_0680 [Serinibacter salmoneus]